MDVKRRIPEISMIIGLDGWGNAGEAATFSVSYLIKKLKASKIGEIDSGGLYNYQISRPYVTIERGVVKTYRKFQNILYEWRSSDTGRRVLLLKGVEPHLNWSRYIKDILKLYRKAGAECIYTLGGYLISFPYVHEPLISGSTNNPLLRSVLERCGVELTNYSGPTSVYSELLWEARRSNIDIVSLWGASPIYIQGQNPIVALHLLRKLLCLLHLKVDLGEMERNAELLRSQLVKESQEDLSLKDYTGSKGEDYGDMPPYTV